MDYLWHQKYKNKQIKNNTWELENSFKSIQQIASAVNNLFQQQHSKVIKAANRLKSTF